MPDAAPSTTTTTTAAAAAEAAGMNDDAASSIELAASRLAESTLKRALAQLICEAIDQETKEEKEKEQESCELTHTARDLVSEAMREAWRMFLDDCDLKEWLEEDPETNLSRHMAQELLRKAKNGEAGGSGKARGAGSQPGTSQVDLGFFQAPGQSAANDPVAPKTKAPSNAKSSTSRGPQETSGEQLNFQFDGADCRIDLRLVGPYLPTLAKTTTIDREGNEVAILLFDSSKLPVRSTQDYDHVMQQMFLTSLYWIEEHMYSNYSIVYLHGNSSKDHWPRAKWLKQWCHALTSKTSKHLSHLFVVFPTLWIRTLRIISRPFVKIKASVHFVSSVRTLLQQLPEAEGVIPKGMLESNSTS